MNPLPLPPNPVGGRTHRELREEPEMDLGEERRGREDDVNASTRIVPRHARRSTTTTPA